MLAKLRIVVGLLRNPECPISMCKSVYWLANTRVTAALLRVNSFGYTQEAIFATTLKIVKN